MTNLETARTTGSQELLWLMRNDRDSAVRFTIAQRLKDQDRLWEMRASETDDTVIIAIDARLHELITVPEMEDTV